MMNSTRLFVAATLVGALGSFSRLQAQLPEPVLITDFSYFDSNELYAAWADAATVIVSGENDYSITAKGYGSNYKYIAALATGMTHLELEVELIGPPEADGKLGPIISLVDDDAPSGTYWNYAFYGQTLGNHVLRAPLWVPSSITNPGSIPGLNFDFIPHMHMQLDPSSYTSGNYTVVWKNLQLYAAPTGDFDGNMLVDGADLLLWQRSRYAFNSSYLNLADFKANFGTPAAAVAGSIPEPSSVLILLSAAGLAGRRIRGQLRPGRAVA